MPEPAPRWVSDGTDDAVSAWCSACSAAFYVTAELAVCPYCGGEDVSPGYVVAVRPE